MLPTLVIENEFENLQKITNYLKELLEEDSLKDAGKLFNTLHPANAALVLQFLGKSERKELIEGMGKYFNPEVLIFLEEVIKDEVISWIATKQFSIMIEQLDERDAIEILKDLTKEQIEVIMPTLSLQMRKSLSIGLSYPENSAGRLMDHNIIAVPFDWTIGQIKHFLRISKILENHEYIFLISKKGMPFGKISTMQLIREKPEEKAKNICEPIDIVFNYLTTIDDIIYSFRKYRVNAAPIINEKNVLIGMINLKDIIDIIHEKAQEDFLHSAGVSESDFYENFLTTSYKRIKWLSISILGALGVSVLINHFEFFLSQNPKITPLLSLITSITTTSAIQVVTVIISAILNRELGIINVKRAIIKEAIVSIINGLFIGGSIGIVLWALGFSAQIAFLLIISFVGSMFFSAVIATTLPFLLHKFDFDPSVSTGSLLSCITDAIAALAFLTLAKFALG